MLAYKFNSYLRLLTLPFWQEVCPFWSLPSSFQGSLGLQMTQEYYFLIDKASQQIHKESYFSFLLTVELNILL